MKIGVMLPQMLPLLADQNGQVREAAACALTEVYVCHRSLRPCWLLPQPDGLLLPHLCGLLLPPCRSI